MAQIETSTLRIGSNDLILQDAEAREDLETVKDGLGDLEETVSQLGGLSDDVKQALLQIAEKVAYIDEDGQDYYDDLYDALYPPVPPADLVSISAVYTQSGTVYDTDTLDSLKSDLVVTAHMSDSTTQTVTAYTLSGTLTAGTSTITVSYSGKTTTFTVTVTSAPTLSSISAVYTQSGTVYDTDTLDSLKTDLVVTATYSDQTTETVTTYTLSGTLEVGTSIITVTYGGKTTTFNVTVTDSSAIQVTYTQGSVGSENTDANRVSGVITSDIHFDDGETLVITITGDYSIFPFGARANNDKSVAGTKYSNNILNVYAISDSGYITPSGSIAGIIKANGTSIKDNASAGWKTSPVTYTYEKSGQYGYTFTGLGFLVKKNDNTDITPSEIEQIISVDKVVS